MLAAVLAAVASACGFALSTSLQHRAASKVHLGVSGLVHLLLRLVRTPLWLLGAVFGAVAFGMHALALNLGVIALVQPIMVSGVVLAILVQSALDRKRPSPAELLAVSVTTAGLMVFLFVVNTEPPDTTPRIDLAVVITVLAFLYAAGVVLGAFRLRKSRLPGLLLGTGAGVLFGVLAGLVKLVGNELTEHGVLAVLTSWEVWPLALAGILGTAMNQRAYQIAPLSISMPILNVVDVIIALLFGLLVFGEAPAHSAAALAVQGVALVVMGVGLREIARFHESSDDPPQHALEDSTTSGGIG